MSVEEIVRNSPYRNRKENRGPSPGRGDWSQLVTIALPLSSMKTRATPKDIIRYLPLYREVSHTSLCRRMKSRQAPQEQRHEGSPSSRRRTISVCLCFDKDIESRENVSEAASLPPQTMWSQLIIGSALCHTGFGSPVLP